MSIKSLESLEFEEIVKFETINDDWDYDSRDESDSDTDLCDMIENTYMGDTHDED